MDADRYRDPGTVAGELRGRHGYAEPFLGEWPMHQLTEAATARQRLAVWPKLRGSGEYRAEFDAGIAVAIVPVPASGAAPRAAPRAAPERDSGHMRQASDRAIM